MTALLCAIVRSIKMKIRSSKKATSNSPAYKQGVIIGGWYGTGEHPLARKIRERKAREKNSES